MAIWTVNLYIGIVEASSREEAFLKAGELLYELSTSNDGSEVLANNDITVDLL